MPYCSRAINDVPTPTLLLQLSCNELANGEDDVLSSRTGTGFPDISYAEILEKLTTLKQKDLEAI